MQWQEAGRAYSHLCDSRAPTTRSPPSGLAFLSLCDDTASDAISRAVFTRCRAALCTSSVFRSAPSLQEQGQQQHVRFPSPRPRRCHLYPSQRTRRRRTRTPYRGPTRQVNVDARPQPNAGCSVVRSQMQMSLVLMFTDA